MRRGEPGALHWPWDQGLELGFLRDLPHQYARRQEERFETAAVFVERPCLRVIDDRGMTVLAALQAPAAASTR